MGSGQANSIGLDLDRATKIRKNMFSRLSTDNRYNDRPSFKKSFSDAMDRNRTKKIERGEYQKKKQNSESRKETSSHDNTRYKKKTIKKSNDYDKPHRLIREKRSKNDENPTTPTDTLGKHNNTPSGKQVAADATPNEINQKIFSESMVSQDKGGHLDNQVKAGLLSKKNSIHAVPKDLSGNTSNNKMMVVDAKTQANKLSFIGKSDAMSNRLSEMELTEALIEKKQMKEKLKTGLSIEKKLSNEALSFKVREGQSQAIFDSAQQAGKKNLGSINKVASVVQEHLKDTKSLKNMIESNTRSINTARTIVENNSAGKQDTSDTTAEVSATLKTSLEGKTANIGGISTIRSGQINTDTSSQSAHATSSGKALPEQSVDKIIKNLMYIVRNNQSEIKIDLRPELLGEMHVSIIAKNSKINISITTDSNSIKEFIETSIGQLRTEFGNHKLDVDEIEVGVNNEFSRQSNKQKSFDGQIINASDDFETGEDDIEENSERPHTAKTQLMSEDGRIDYYV